MSKKPPTLPLESELFRRINDFSTAATSTLERQSKQLLGLWDRALSGKVEVKDLIGESMRVWVQGFDEGLELLTSPLRHRDGKDRTPASLVFVVDDVAETAPAKRVDSPVEVPVNAKLAVTDLRRLDGRSCAPLPAANIKVSIDAGGDTITVELVNLKGKLEVGHYAGVIYIGGPGEPGAPLVVVNLFVTASNQHRDL